MSFAAESPEILHHNNPPADLLLGTPLRERLEDENRDIIERRDELLEAATRIPPITSEDIAKKVGDYIKQLAELAKKAEAKRVDAKEPYLEGTRNVDGFFKLISEPVLKIKTNVERTLTIYLREKADAERRERMEQERLARIAAETARREAEEAARAATDAKTLDTAIEAEKAAETASADLVKAAAAADAKHAELSRTRGEYGSMSSLRTSWTFDEIDRATIDLEALRPYLPTDGLDKAVRAFIKAGGRELKGTSIYETTAAVVR